MLAHNPTPIFIRSDWLQVGPPLPMNRVIATIGILPPSHKLYLCLWKSGM